MRRSSPPITRRLVDTVPSTTREARLVAIVKEHKRGPAPALAPGVAARIRRRLGERSENRARPRLWRAVRVIAVVLAGLFSVQAVAFLGPRLLEVARARVARMRAGYAAPARGTVHEPSLRVDSPLPATALPAPPTVGMPEIGKPAQKPDSSTAAPASRPPTHRRAAPPAPSIAAAAGRAPRTTDTYDAEAALLQRGLELRRAGDLTSAVSTFAEYRRTYPKGSFWSEATIAQLGLLIALGHREDALTLLEQVGDDPKLPRSAELQRLRAELSAPKADGEEGLPGAGAGAWSDAGGAGLELPP